MRIYVAHTKFDGYTERLYEPFMNSELARRHTLIFPHELSAASFDSRAMFFGRECHLVIAEVTHRSTSLGIELGWANALGVPIICVHVFGTRSSSSLDVISKDIIAYTRPDTLIPQLLPVVAKHER
jgi:hypothetical protein